MTQAVVPLLAFESVTKRFGGTLAVDAVSIALRAGTVLALLGENGAGKSTLIKILAGVHRADGGRVLLRGTPYDHLARRRTGTDSVAFIHQDLGLIDWMTVAENVALGIGYRRRTGLARGLIDRAGCREAARQALDRLGVAIDPNMRVMHLSRTERSLVAIARALASDATVLVLDEPTASLPADEVERLLATLRELRGSGVGMIYVSHRLDEVFAVADDVAVLRDGRLVGQHPVADVTPGRLIEMIVGRPPADVFVHPAPARRPVRLALRGVRAGDAGPVTLDLHDGELLALVGLRGAGQDAIGRAVAGGQPFEGGDAVLDGAPYAPAGIAAALAVGVGLVPADRVGEGLGMPLSVRENMFLNPGADGRHVLAPNRRGPEATLARTLGARMSLRPNAPERPVETLSGGNQQKVVLARAFRLARRVLVLEEPTAGVDVGAKAEIYALLRAALADGLAVLLIATDFEEVAAISHRAIVFSRGRAVAELDGGTLTTATLLEAASIAVPTPSTTDPVTAAA